jgi:hypothetical protein
MDGMDVLNDSIETDLHHFSVSNIEDALVCVKYFLAWIAPAVPISHVPTPVPCWRFLVSLIFPVSASVVVAFVAVLLGASFGAEMADLPP